MNRRVYREDSEQAALIQWADLAPMPPYLSLHHAAKIGEYLFAIPNGGLRNAREAARLKGLGVRAGVSDLFFSFPSPQGKHGLYIEMKAPIGNGARVSDKQHAFLTRMLFAGYECTVCYGWEAARRAIDKHLMNDL